MPTFTPPTFEAPMQTSVRPLNYFRLTWASSVVRVNGVFTTVRSPSVEALAVAGTEGTDYFIGGHIYNISNDLGAELQIAGYVVDLPGYGTSAYGYGPYGG